MGGVACGRVLHAQCGQIFLWAVTSIFELHLMLMGWCLLVACIKLASGGWPNGQAWLSVTVVLVDSSFDCRVHHTLVPPSWQRCSGCNVCCVLLVVWK